MLSERLEKMTSRDKENIEVLVKSIIEKDENMIHVKDSALISYYPHTSKYIVEIEPEDKADLRYCWSKNGNEFSEDFCDLKEKQLILAQKIGANYVFVSNFYQKEKLLSIITPFMIISRKETEFLLKNFYKNVPEKVSKAASELGITIFDKYYLSYLKNKLDDAYTSREEYDKYLDFIHFVFGLPYEEQNIAANRKILEHNYTHFDSTSVLAKEYSEGKHFQEYFDELYYKQDKEKVVSKIELLERKPDHDVFLLKKGFVVGENSAMELYKTDAKAFINYFRKLGDESRKIIIEKIYEDSFVNQEVVGWLEKSYTDLLREVGFSGGKQNGSNR
ncbi:MAG: hypothetical protein Q8O03_02115 [Nanoarchaeota archaeon]|nr:hypothetical protein [Nanoarchaeota archaeon]